MKKKSQSFSQNFKMPHLFREDLEELENIIKDLSPRQCKFETKDFEYNSIQEISEKAMARNDFHIQMYDPYISIDFCKTSARIYSSDDDIKALGIVKKMSVIIEKRERKSLWKLSKLSNFLAPILIWSPFILMMFFSKEIIKLNIVLFVITVLITWFMAIIWWMVAYHAYLKNFSFIEFVYKKNKSNFFTRNKDQIIVGIIVAIISIVATLFFQYFFK